jgi:hypothetical protein
MTDYAAVLTAIRPGAQWTLDGNVARRVPEAVAG